MIPDSDYITNFTRDLDNDPMTCDLEPMTDEELDDLYHQLMDEEMQMVIDGVWR